MTNTDSKTPTKSSAGLRPYADFFGWPAFDQFRRQMDSFFRDLPGRKFFPEAEPFARFLTGFSALPAVDLVEKEHEYRISAELPGLDEKNVEVKVAGGVLTISGEKRDEREEKDEYYSFSERRYGAFKRAFRLPEDVDTDKITARFGKGVLTITLPKSEAAKAAEKKIDIKPK